MISLQHEEAIVWLEDVSQLPYVREDVITWARWRRKPIRRHAGRIVGYSVLKPDAPNTGYPCHFTRWVFWLAPHDIYTAGEPMEAVAPRSVAPGERGVHPEYFDVPDIGPFKSFIESLDAQYALSPNAVEEAR